MKLREETAYFGKPLIRAVGNGRATKVHFLRDGKPLCGYKPAKGYISQFCCARFNYSYVECRKCKFEAQKGE